MTDPTSPSPARVGFEPCVDDGGPFDEIAFIADGHHTPTLALMVALARAVHYECDYDRQDVTDLLATVTWNQGFVGKHPDRYDYLACDDDGTCQTDYDDDGNEIVLTDVKPVTWAAMRANAPSRHAGLAA